MRPSISKNGQRFLSGDCGDWSGIWSPTFVQWVVKLNMPSPKLEEVFKTSGVPTFTFVKPVEFDRLIVALRTAGRGLVIEGPSGIGKTTSVLKALEQLRAC